MDDHSTILAQLFKKYMAKSANAGEEERLAELVEKTNDDQINGLLADHWRKFKKQEPFFSDDKKQKILREILDTHSPAFKKIPIYKKITFRWYAAASALLVIFLSTHFLALNKKDIAHTPFTHDIQAPDKSKATITLADGNIIYLDSAGYGLLAQSKNIKLVKLADGQIAYQIGNGEVTKELQYNTLTNPRGSKAIDMRLSDGSHVWLNAGSSVTFPIAFIGDERKITLKGEGYFEVAKDAHKRFIVEANGSSIEVLGTHFNVNAYSDDNWLNVTLLEGSVKVSGQQKSSGSVVLKPGQQAALKKLESNIQLSYPDLNQVMAWKNGFFSFDGLSFEEVMKKIERWYNVNVVFTAAIPNIKLEGDLSQNTSLNGALEALIFQGAKVKVEGTTVFVY